MIKCDNRCCVNEGTDGNRRTIISSMCTSPRSQVHELSEHREVLAVKFPRAAPPSVPADIECVWAGSALFRRGAGAFAMASRRFHFVLHHFSDLGRRPIIRFPIEQALLSLVSSGRRMATRIFFCREAWKKYMRGKFSCVVGP